MFIATWVTCFSYINAFAARCSLNGPAVSEAIVVDWDLLSGPEELAAVLSQYHCAQKAPLDPEVTAVLDAAWAEALDAAAQFREVSEVAERVQRNVKEQTELGMATAEAAAKAARAKALADAEAKACTATVAEKIAADAEADALDVAMADAAAAYACVAELSELAKTAMQSAWSRACAAADQWFSLSNATFHASTAVWAKAAEVNAAKAKAAADAEVAAARAKAAEDAAAARAESADAADSTAETGSASWSAQVASGVSLETAAAAATEAAAAATVDAAEAAAAAATAMKAMERRQQDGSPPKKRLRTTGRARKPLSSASVDRTTVAGCGGFLVPDPSVTFGGVIELITATKEQASNMSKCGTF